MTPQAMSSFLRASESSLAQALAEAEEIVCGCNPPFQVTTSCRGPLGVKVNRDCGATFWAVRCVHGAVVGFDERLND